LDGERIVASPEKLRPRATVRERDSSYVLRIEADPRVREILLAGVAVLEGAPPCLHSLAATELTGERLERLPSELCFGPERVAELVGKVLPELERQIEIEICTERLPRGTRRMRPHVMVDVEQREAQLSVIALLVYGDPPAARIDDGRVVHLQGELPIRSEREEQRVIEKLHADLDLVVGRRLAVSGADAVQMAQRLRDYDGKLSGDAHVRCYPPTPLAPQLATRGGEGQLSFGVDGLDADPAEVVAAWQRGDSHAPLLGGGMAPLPSDWLARYGALAADLLAARDERGTVTGGGRIALLRMCDALEQPRSPELEKLAPLVDGFECIEAAPLPDDLKATLRAYQKAGVDWLSFLKRAGLGAVLADDMGLGKTLQALCVLDGRSLVVCPTSVIHNWVDEIRRFRPSLSVNIFHGSNRALDDADVTLTSYALMRNDSDVLGAIRWDNLILDEAQAIKNPDSQLARAAYSMNAVFRLSLTGTPLENRLEELWSQVHFTNPGVLGGRQAFVRRYVDGAGLGDLRARIRPFLLRRLKSEVASDLPPRTNAVLHCELGEDERRLYGALQANTRTHVVEQLAAGGSVMQALEALLRLRQAACHPALVPGGERFARSAKIERLLLALEQVASEGHKALVFSQWTSLLDRVEPALREAGIEWVRLDGSTRDRAAVVRAFQSDGGPPVMLLSLKAGGTGLNLTAADHVFLLDPWWNPAVEEQAADRAHRIGQDKPVMLYRLVAKDTVEERILALQQRKRDLAEAALGEGGAALGLTRADLLSLLGDA